MTKKPLIIKKSPVIIIRNLIVLQFLVTGIYFLAAVIANYGEIYQELTFSQILSYEIAKNLFIISGETLLISYILLRWFFATYTFYPDLFISEWGVIFKHRQSVSLNNSMSISVHHSPLSRIFRYGTIIIKNKSAKPFSLTHVSDPEIVSQEINEQIAQSDEAEQPEQLLQKRGHEKLEFKSSFRWDTKERQVNKAMEKMIMKTVAAFLNSQGGQLMIGVGDQNEIIGLADDYNSLSRKNADGFENHFNNVFRATLGSEFRQCIKLSFHTINDKDICLIKILPSPKPAYTKFDNEESFYVRTGNSSTALQLSQATNYIRSRWG